jgi:hypothetical protein
LQDVKELIPKPVTAKMPPVEICLMNCLLESILEVLSSIIQELKIDLIYSNKKQIAFKITSQKMSTMSKYEDSKTIETHLLLLINVIS